MGGQLPGGLIADKRMMKIPDVSVLGGTRNALPELSEIRGRLVKGFAKPKAPASIIRPNLSHAH